MKLYEIDPEGDVLLTLHNSNAPFAVWDDAWETKIDSWPGSKLVPDPEPVLEPDPDALPYTELEFDDEPIKVAPDVQLLLSSRHLILASDYFRRLLQGPWKEGTVIHSDGRRHISAEGWDEVALVIFMQVIHGYNRKVPRSLTVGMFAKIAVLVDYYQCHEAFMLWADLWELFKEATEVALNDCKNNFPTLDLPIVDVAEKINLRRQERIYEIFNYLYGLRAPSTKDSIGCDFACSSMLLGALTIQMHQKGLDITPEPPYIGHSVASVTKTVLDFESPVWYTEGRHWAIHNCSLTDVLKKSVLGNVQGLNLADIRKEP
ncbi:hypothetical protein F4805DRAFT_472530 [Annulohypoxylon moriforme]|nr:hypothetical protein F4805DRAFT_472530 [Annulohypoxylon moriforme]